MKNTKYVILYNKKKKEKIVVITFMKIMDFTVIIILIVCKYKLGTALITNVLILILHG